MKEEKTIFNRQKLTQYQTVETMSSSKNEIRIAVFKHLNAKRIP